MGKVKVYADELAAGNDEKILSNNPITLTESTPLNDMDGTDLVTKDNLADLPTGYVSYEIAVTGSSKVIDWQNDLIDGINTYADILGNNLPKAFHYFKDGDNYTRGGVEPVIVRVAGVIDTVTFDWGYSTDCVIVF